MTQWRFVRRGRSQWAVVTVFVVLLCIPLLPSGYVERIRSIGDTSADVTGSADARWNDMIAARNYVLRNPLMGAGVVGQMKDLVGKPATLDDGRPGGFYLARFRNLAGLQ